MSFKKTEGRKEGVNLTGIKELMVCVQGLLCPLFFGHGAVSIKANEDMALKDMELSTTQLIFRLVLNTQKVLLDPPKTTGCVPQYHKRVSQYLIFNLEPQQRKLNRTLL